MSGKSKEYLMLRAEILHNLHVIDNSRNLLYLSIVAILAFTFTNNKSTGYNDTLIFLLPYIVIYPIYLVTIDYAYSMYKIGAYLKEFHEKNYDDFQWETRLYKYNNFKKKYLKVGRFSWVFHIPFLSTSFACSALSLFFLLINSTDSIAKAEHVIRFCTPIILLIITGFIFLTHLDIKSVQEKNIIRWRLIKAREVVCKKDNEDNVKNNCE